MSQPPSSRSTVSRSLPTSVSEVAAHGDRAAAALFDGADGFGGVGDVGDHHFGALAGQSLAEGLPNPVGSTRDDCALTGRHFPAFSRLFLGFRLWALTVNIQKPRNFQNNSRTAAKLSSAYPGRRRATWARSWGWRFVTP
jgi:hypothetical protein